MKQDQRNQFYNTFEFSMNDLSCTNPKQYWKIMNMLIKENSNSDERIPPINSENNHTAISDVDKAQFVNDYFVSISTLHESNANLPVFGPISNATILQFEITEQDIIDMLDIIRLSINQVFLTIPATKCKKVVP